MASVVCQGLQSCLEPRVIESMVLTNKLSSKPTQLHRRPEIEGDSLIDNNGERINKNKRWSFFSVLENPSSNHVKTEEVYVHPMAKHSAAALSTKSLEMCTESLGTETGSDVSDSSDEFSWEDRERFVALQRSKARIFGRQIQSHRGGGFPPPLSSISGSDGTVKVRPHREGGRLVIRAVSVSYCGTKFQAERTDGRLRLSLLKDCSANLETGRVKMKNEGGKEECCENENNEEEEEEEGGGWWWDSDGNRGKVMVETGIDESKWPTRFPNSFEDSNEFGLTRCKEGGNGNKGITNWSSFQVAIS